VASRIQPCRLIIACALALAPLLCAAVARAQTAPAQVDASSIISVRVNLTNHSSGWFSSGSTVSLEMGAGAGDSTVIVRAIHIAAPTLSCTVGGSGSTTVTITGLTVNALPGAGVTLPLQPDGTNSRTFTGQGLAATALGVVNYSTTGVLCNSLQSSGGSCNGPFNLSSPGTSTSGQFTAGSISTSAGPSGARTFALTYYASFPLATGATWGSVDVLGQLTGTFPSGSASTCPADFNQAGGVTISDIFDFLNAWFAGDPRADFNHVGGITVQDIFDFLNTWFVGC
jgi:hypothetical protein